MRKSEKDPALDAYLVKIGEMPLLSREEEVELAKTIETGKEALKTRTLEDLFLYGYPADTSAGTQKIADGEAAKRLLIESNYRLVVHIAKKYRRKLKNMSFFELIGAGNEGLFPAVELFDWRKGYRFSTYAYRWIWNFIIKALSNNKPTLFIDDLMDSGENTMEDTRHDSSEHQAKRKEGDRALKMALEKLAPAQQQVVSMHFGLNNGTPHNIKEIAKALQIGKRKVQNILEKALKNLGKNRKLKDLR